ncbi:hypothetical protein BASA62_004670 [Batrachochytrium salamandrivorans]|nr:hypothetical protein BASA62_004670 [Batrachochytrium salamandrivorans]
MADVPLPSVTITVTNAVTLSARWKAAMDTIEQSLTHIPALVALEKTYKITKRHCVLLAVASTIWAILVIKNIQGGPLTDIVGFSYPAYASIKAVEIGDKIKYTHWISYWIMFGLLKVVENFHMAVLHMFPFYFFFKVVLLSWSMSQYTMGAYVVYHLTIKHWVPYLDKTIGFILGVVMSTALKASTDAAPPTLQLLYQHQHILSYCIHVLVMS